MGKQIDGKQLLEDSKNKVKQNKQKETNMKKSIIITVIITLAFVAALAGSFIAGIKYQDGNDTKIHNEAKSLSQVATVETKK